MKFQKGDVVLIGNGKVHWEVLAGGHEILTESRYLLLSPMSGRRKVAFEHQIKPWTPGA